MAANEDDLDAHGNKGVVQVNLKLPPSLGRAVKRTARELSLFPAEYVRAVLRGDQEPPEIEEEDDADDEDANDPAADEDREPIEGEPPNVLSDLRTQTEDREANEDGDAPGDEESEEELPRPRRRSGSGGVSLG